MKLYIANKMSGLPDANYPWFGRAKTFLMDLGFEVASPAEMNVNDGIPSHVSSACVPYSDLWWERLRKDAAVIMQSDGIAFGPQWRDSIGAKLERELGLLFHLPFFYVDPAAGTFMPEKIVGLSGVARCGKDTAAMALEAEGWARMGFAGPLKDIAYGADPIIDLDWDGRSYGLAALVDEDGWERAKTVGDTRGFLQRLGTEGGRRVLGPNFWVQTLFKVNQSERLAVPDVRFPEEKDAIERRGGVVIRIERPGVKAINDHASEHALDGVEFKHVIQNDGTPEELGKKVKAIVSAHYEGASL